MPWYHGGSANINLFAGYDCSSSWIQWSAQDPLTLTIVSGSQYASFYGWDAGSRSEVRLGPVVNTTGTNIQNYSTSPYLVADGIQPDSVAEWVVVQGESGGLTSTDSIQVLPPPVAVTFAPPEIPPGDTADIILKERNPDGTTADFPPDQLFEVGISSGNSYGTILSSGDTAGYFASVPQGLKFIAVDSIRADSAMVGVQVEPAMALPSAAAPGRNGSDNKAVVSRSKSVSQNVRSPSAIVSAAMAANGRRKSVSFTDGQYSIGWVKITKNQS